VPDCGRAARARGLCSAHYRRLLAHGDVRADDPVGRHHRPGMGRPPRVVGQTKRFDHGYTLVYDPKHGNAQADGFVYEHRRVLAEQLGRPLYRTSWFTTATVTGQTIVPRISSCACVGSRLGNASPTCFPGHGSSCGATAERADESPHETSACRMDRAATVRQYESQRRLSHETRSTRFASCDRAPSQRTRVHEARVVHASSMRRLAAGAAKRLSPREDRSPAARLKGAYAANR
jgi:hypothetical protein